MVWGGSNANPTCYLRDRVTGTTRRVGLSEAGDPLDGGIMDWSLTRDADGILFETGASNAKLPPDTNGESDIYFRKNCLVLWPDGDGEGQSTLGSLLRV